MDVYIIDKPKQQLAYNCSSDQQVITFEEAIAGGSFLAMYVIFMLLYVPCLWVMCTSDRRGWTSYKLMIQLGFTQLIGLQFAGLYMGIITIWGDIFCLSIDFEYITCALACSYWVTTTTTGNILGINRICELYSTNLARTLFENWKLYIWMMFPIAYGAGMFLYRMYIWASFSLLINMHCWYLPSAVSKAQMESYLNRTNLEHFENISTPHINRILAFHSISVCIIELIINSLLVILYRRAIRNASQTFRMKMRYEKQIVVQVVLIGLINFVTSLICTLIQLLPPSLVTTPIGTAGFIISQGITSIVYLTINPSIRDTILWKLGLRSVHVGQLVLRVRGTQKSTRLSTIGASTN